MGMDAYTARDPGRARRRSIAWSTVLALILGIPVCALSADLALAKKVSRPDTLPVTHVNRTVPKVTAPPAELTFASTPTEAGFLHTGLFPEPLVPVAATAEPENRDLAQALLTYRDAVRQSGASDAVEPILAFLAAYPGSAWKPALQLDLGLIYRQTGHFSKALEIWQQGWSETKALTDPRGTALANAIVGHLSQLDAYLGHKELLQTLLDSIHGRTIGGTATQLIVDSHTGLFEMEHEPEVSFRCGPLALKRILNYTSSRPSSASLRVLDDAQSTPVGLSLSAVKEIAFKAGMRYQMAFRTPGAAVIMPAVAHWSVGHYAAVVDRKDGRYLVQDTTFGEDIRMSPATLDEEASGYFLVPAGILPDGWRNVSEDEGARVWGRGTTGSNHDGGAGGLGGPCPCCTSGGGSSSGGSSSGGSSSGGSSSGGSSSSSGGGQGSGCTSSTVETEVVGLQLRDAPVGYVPPLGPKVFFNLVYSHRDTQQPTTLSYTNFGPKWTFDWLSYITDSVNSSAAALLYRRGGGNEPFTFSSTSATTAYPGPYSQGTLTRTVNTGGATTSFTLTYPDGSFQQFNQALGSQFFMTAVGDKAGNKITLTYDSQMRIVAITDAIGQVSTLTYGLSGSPLVVTKITDPFGRSASFTYNSSGLLSSITDVLGITSSYTYGQGSDPDFVNTLTTPYGSTTFTYGDSSTNSNLGNTRFLKTVDPLGRTSYVEFDQSVDAGDTSGGVMKDPTQIPTGMNTDNNNLQYRNTFIFDPNEYALAQGTTLNYSLAKVVHWLHSYDGVNASRVIESEKEPLENRVWYNYPGQPNTFSFGVSSTGTVTNGASNQPIAVGRVLDDGTTQLRTYQYNSEGNITQATDPVGRQMTYTYASNGIDLLSTNNTTNGTQLLETRTYNSQHLPLTITGVNGLTAHLQYNLNGQLTRYIDPLGHATARTYDSSGHLKTVQQPVAGSLYTFSYDSVSRLAALTDPAGGTIHYTYDAADRLLTATFPDGTVSRRSYNLLDMASVTDRLGQMTKYSYDANREPIKTTDALGHTVTYGYNPTGKLNSITDPNGHTTTTIFDAQSRPITKQYTNGQTTNTQYETTISLLAAITDALGQSKIYTYNPDNTIATVSYSANQPTASVSFAYDPAYRRTVSMTDGVGTTTYTYYPVSSTPALGATQLQSMTSPIAGAAGTDTVTYGYDALDRLLTIAVDGFVPSSMAYDANGRPTSLSNPLDTFSYAYSDATPRVTGLTSNEGVNLAMTYYGPTGDELLQQITAVTHSGAGLVQFGYVNNADHNATSFASSSPIAQTTAYAYDKANRIVSATIGSGSPQYSYGYDPSSNLISITTNGTQQSFSYTSTNAIASGAYDANGSPLALGGSTYTWDGENRLIGLSGPSNTASSFTYDGLGRLVRIVDSASGTVTADHSYFWCGQVRCLARDNTQSGSPVTTQYFDQGMISGGAPYYYVRDKLGSVRELVSSGGSVAAQYDYDPYGNRTTISGTVSSDIGFAGYFHHDASGLDFTLYRAYDPIHGRWLNRDPIGESGGVNLYSYVNGNSVNSTDRTGLMSGFGACVVACIGSFASVCYLPGVPQAVCAACLALPEPFGAICLVRCNATPVINCIGAVSVGCVALCGLGCIL